MKYSDEIKHPLWQKKRADLLKRDNYTCQLCGDTETQLHVNHLLYQKRPWEVPDEYLQTLCAHCHYLYHSHVDNKIPPPVKVIKYPIPGYLGCAKTFAISEMGISVSVFSGYEKVGKSVGISYEELVDVLKHIPEKNRVLISDNE